MISSKHYQIVREFPINLNQLSNFFSEVHQRNFPKLSQIILLAAMDVLFIIFILFIISGCTWSNNNKNLPIVSWSFFVKYKFMSRAIPQIEAQKALISVIVISRQTDHQTGSWKKIANKVVKLAIFEFIMWKWSRDPSCLSIYSADYYEHIFVTKKSLRNQKIAKVLIFGFFLK